MKTLQQRKVVLALAFDYPFGIRCADWDSGVETLLAHPAFRPMDLPRTGLVGPTYLHLKIQKITWQSSHEQGEGRPAIVEQHIAHIVLQGHNGDHNMSLEQNLWYPEGVASLCDDNFDLRFVLAVFQGLRVILLSWTTNGRLYAAGPGASVSQLGTPRVRLEIRGMPKDSYEACGHDGDIVDLQFSDVANRVEAEARAQVCSLEALRISHCVGYSLGSLISAARPLGARIDGPDFQLQHAMLARVHAKWLSNTNADGGGGVVPTEGGAPAPQPASPLSRPAPSGAGGAEHQELGQPRWTNIENMLNGAYHVIYTAPIVVGEPRAVPRAALQMHRYDGPIGDAVDPAAPHTATPPPEPPLSVRAIADQSRLAVQIRQNSGPKPPPPSPPSWPKKAIAPAPAPAPAPTPVARAA